MAGRILSDSIEGIPLRDEDLLREFGEPELDGLILGGIEASVLHCQENGRITRLGGPTQKVLQ